MVEMVEMVEIWSGNMFFFCLGDFGLGDILSPMSAIWGVSGWSGGI